MYSSQMKKAMGILFVLFNGDQYLERKDWRRRFNTTPWYCQYHYQDKTIKVPDLDEFYLEYYMEDKRQYEHRHYIKYKEALDWLLSLDWEGSGIDEALQFFVDRTLDDRLFHQARAKIANGLRALKQRHRRSRTIRRAYKRMMSADIPWDPKTARSCIKILNNRCLFDKEKPAVMQLWWREMYDLVVDSYDMGLLDYKLTAKLRAWCELQDYRFGIMNFYYEHPKWSMDECWKTLRDIFCANLPAKIRRNYFNTLSWLEMRENERC